jgi:hypothetical protein
MLMKLSRRLLLSAWLLEAAPKDLSIAGIRFTVLHNGRSRNRYLHIHGNETTARDVLRQHLQRVKGTGFFVVSDKRNVPAGPAQIDPNRMFSAIGAEASLRRLNPTLSPNDLSTALALLAKDRDRFIRAILPPKNGRMIALHNNGPGYSIDDEAPISDEVARKDPENPRDFMLATNPKDYARIAAGPFNVVLQTGSMGREDGSFSRLAASRGLRYVNIEAALGKSEKQAKMLSFLEDVLP